MPIDHTGIMVDPSKMEEVVAWYIKALKPIGYAKIHDFGGRAVGMGDPVTDFWIGAQANKGDHQHFAFQAKERSIVDKFYEAAIEAGGKDNGKPGPRPHFGPNYYAAFVFDPVGNNVEVVCRAEE